MDRRQKNKTYSLLKGTIRFIVFCFCIFIPILIFFLTCNLENVIIEGNTKNTEEELKKRLINTSTDGNTILLYLRHKYGKIAKIPFVEEVNVELLNKNEVKIQVYEKVVTGCIEFMGSYMYFDKDGIIVESSNEKLDKVPFVSGLLFSKIVLYEKLEIQKEELFQVILNITQLIYKYELPVDTITFNKDFEITLNLEDIEVLLGKRETYDEQIAELKNLIPKSIGKKLSIDMKNFTEGQDRIIAKPKY